MLYLNVAEQIVGISSSSALRKAVGCCAQSHISLYIKDWQTFRISRLITKSPYALYAQVLVNKFHATRALFYERVE